MPKSASPEKVSMLREFSADASLRELTEAWRAYRRRVDLRIDGRPAIRVAIAGNYSTQFLTQAVELALVQRGYAPQIYEAGYNQYEIELADPQSGLSRFTPDIIILTLTSQLLSVRVAPGSETEFAEWVADSVNAAAKRLSVRIVLTLPEPLEEEIEQTGWARRWRRRLTDHLESRLDPAVCTVSLDPLIARIGTENWFSSRHYATSKLPFAPDHTARLGDYLANLAASTVSRPVRLVVTDLDDTLWGGTVGEIGWENVDLDAEGVGYGFLRLQHWLAGLHEAGVLLAICSKNDENEAFDVFRKRREMVLHEEHFAAKRINWRPKSENFADILTELNLTQPGCVFLDDNPMERHEVDQRLPDVWVPDLPADPNERPAMLARSGRFTLPGMTAADVKRQEMYRAEQLRRKDLSGGGSLEDYYNTLRMTLTPARPDQGNWQRVLDLIRKTNQFNLTTRRYTAKEIREFVEGDGNEVWTYSLADRFGEYGLISVLIGVPRGDALEIDTWLMSCRAMGRTVENAVFAHIIDRARQTGLQKIRAAYIPTDKNAPVVDLLPRLGFRETGQDGDAEQYEYDVGDQPAGNPYIALTTG